MSKEQLEKDAVEASRSIPLLDGAFDDYLPLAAIRTAPGEYDIVASDGHRLWSMEGTSLAVWICMTINERRANAKAGRPPKETRT